jgi:drug/metabolite transporter (DMT)-like permease
MIEGFASFTTATEGEIMESQKPPIPIAIPTIVGIIAVSFSAIFIKWCAAPASIIGMYRLLLTVVVFAPFAWAQRRAFRDCGRKDWLLLGISGFFLGLHFLFWIASLKHTSVTSSMIITALQPIFVMAGAFFAFSERPRLTAMGSVSLAILGACVIGWADIHVSGETLLGDLQSLLGTVAISVYMLVGQGIRRRIPSTLYNSVVFAIAGIVLGIYNLIARIPLTGYSWSSWQWFLLLALIPTVFGHALFNWMLKYVNAVTISVSILGEPVGAIVLAALLLNEHIQILQLLGGCLCLVGVWIFLQSQTLAGRNAA